MAKRFDLAGPQTGRLRELARMVMTEVYSRGDGDHEVEQQLRACLKADAVLRDALIAELLDRAIRQAVRWAASDPPPHPTADLLHADAFSRETGYRYQFSTGQRLGQARRAEVLAEAERQFLQSREHLETAKWLRSIAAHLTDDRTPVSTVLSARQLQELRRRAAQFGLSPSRTSEVA